ncbi:MAG: GHKL domain-containing protein [Faecalicatena sp.]|uniref:GHKL domain-containing protein n=1 Tax=Faecalicatena sp. TaxID=2005360 RepID=UPI00258BE609|nr:GHKL domain-containing protein [Faecalicatena sp.]MCI6465517.1 GHKL domain-containing protein [Faecalicatena sp.]MDY5617349.1 GHKL domain-containing protein [Lachnospiraceae bacterium]
MLETILSWTEATFTFAFLIFGLTRTYPFKRRRVPSYMAALFWIFLFTAVYKPLEIYTGNFYVYLSVMFLFALLFTYLFQKEALTARISFIITYIYSLVFIKSSLLRAPLFVTTRQSDSDWFSLLGYPIFYIALALCTIFLITHPLVFQTRFPLKYNVLMLLGPFIVAVTAQSYLSLSIKSSQNPLFSIIMPLCILCIILITYYLNYMIITTYQNLLETNTFNQRLQLQIDNMKRSSALIAQIRQEKHELRNNYFYIQSLVKSKNYEELEKYLDTELGYRFDTLEEFQTGNVLLDHLLTQKVSEAREQEIHIITDVLLPPELFIKDNDLCAVLMNLLDNAIDASKTETQKEIHLTLSVVKNYLNILVKNKCTRDILGDNPALKTTKKDKRNHGLGLKIIHSIVDKYNGIFKASMENGYFAVHIMLEMEK